MRVLNAYAGIGGNRHLWPADWNVTAVELDERVAAEYARRYPDDIVLVEDAHAHVMERAHDYDAVWTSPPCPTHSRLAKSVAARTGRELQPDPRLWAEIEHLRAARLPYVVENVHTYYAPPIPPDVVTQRHYYWASGVPVLLTPHAPARWHGDEKSTDDYAVAYGVPLIPPGAVRDPRKAMRNAVLPREGLDIAAAAFAAALVPQPSGSESPGMGD